MDSGRSSFFRPSRWQEPSWEDKDLSVFRFGDFCSLPGAYTAAEGNDVGFLGRKTQTGHSSVTE